MYRHRDLSNQPLFFSLFLPFSSPLGLSVQLHGAPPCSGTDFVCLCLAYMLSQCVILFSTCLDSNPALPQQQAVHSFSCRWRLLVPTILPVLRASKGQGQLAKLPWAFQKAELWWGEVAQATRVCQGWASCRQYPDDRHRGRHASSRTWLTRHPSSQSMQYCPLMTSNSFHHGADVQGRERAKVSNSWPGLKGGAYNLPLQKIKRF